MNNGHPFTRPQVVLAVALHVICTAVALWDLYSFAYLTREDTVSSIVRAWARRVPVIPFVVGMLIGHLFWQSDAPPPPPIHQAKDKDDG